MVIQTTKNTVPCFVKLCAEILASQGLLITTMEYLKLLGSEELSTELVILKDRIALSKKAIERSRRRLKISTPSLENCFAKHDSRFSETNSLPVVRGLVVIAKNPCLHPKDVRILEMNTII